MSAARWSIRGVPYDVLAVIFSRVSPRLVRRLPVSRLRGFLLLTIERACSRRPRTFETTTCFGARIKGSTADTIQRFIYVFGVWEPNITEWAQGHLRPGDSVIDIGANIGYYSLLARSCVGRDGKILAFEAVPSIASKLRESIKDNAADVEVHAVVVGENFGQSEVFRAPQGGQSGTTAEPGSVSEGEVQQVAASEAIPSELWSSIRLVKIDVEGAELDVLRGLEPVLLGLPSGAALLLEVTPQDLKERGQSTEELLALLDSAGFDVMRIVNSYQPHDYAFRQPHVPEPLTGTLGRLNDLVCVKR